MDWLRLLPPFTSVLFRLLSLDHDRSHQVPKVPNRKHHKDAPHNKSPATAPQVLSTGFELEPSSRAENGAGVDGGELRPDEELIPLQYQQHGVQELELPTRA